MPPCGPVSRKAGTWLDTKPSAPTSPACLSEGDATALRYLSEAMVERWSGKETPENFCFRKPHFCYVTLSCLFWIRLKFSLFRAYFLDFSCCQFFCLKTWFTGSLFQNWYSRFACYVCRSNGNFKKLPQLTTSRRATILYFYIAHPAWFDCRPDLNCSRLVFKRVQVPRMAQ